MISVATLHVRPFAWLTRAWAKERLNATPAYGCVTAAAFRRIVAFFSQDRKRAITTAAGQGGPKMATIPQLIASHKAALAKMRETEDGADATKYDAAVEAESAALEALARTRCGTIQDFENKLGYLVAYSREAPEGEDRLDAIRIAAEAWLVERAIFSA